MPVTSHVIAETCDRIFCLFTNRNLAMRKVFISMLYMLSGRQTSFPVEDDLFFMNMPGLGSGMNFLSLNNGKAFTAVLCITE